MKRTYRFSEMKDTLSDIYLYIYMESYLLEILRFKYKYSFANCAVCNSGCAPAQRRRQQPRVLREHFSCTLPHNNSITKRLNIPLCSFPRFVFCHQKPMAPTSRNKINTFRSNEFIFSNLHKYVL